MYNISKYSVSPSTYPVSCRLLIVSLTAYAMPHYKRLLILDRELDEAINYGSLGYSKSLHNLASFHPITLDYKRFPVSHSREMNGDLEGWELRYDAQVYKLLHPLGMQRYLREVYKETPRCEGHYHSSLLATSLGTCWHGDKKKAALPNPLTPTDS